MTDDEPARVVALLADSHDALVSLVAGLSEADWHVGPKGGRRSRSSSTSRSRSDRSERSSSSGFRRAERRLTIAGPRCGMTDDLRARTAPHPIAGVLDAYQWLLFLGAHTLRHVQQIREAVRASH